MAGFVDEAQLHAKAGDGGAGAVSFRREAHVARGGPDGGDGGRGGDVWLVAQLNQASLLGFRDHPFRRAGDGTHGSGKRRHGQRGAELVVPVPVGTIVRDRAGVPLCDLSGEGDRWLAARGGAGGRGNARFLSNTRRAPAFAEQGERGEERWLDMELKLVADVALVGYPNAGKSTLIAAISAAKPKIAPYPFTTLEPNLGVVRLGRDGDEVEMVVADVPGLVEGAADGRGLGHRFLRHVERARVLVVLCDLASAEAVPPAHQEQVLLGELRRYRPALLDRPRLVVGSKVDAAGAAALAGAPEMRVSAATGQGVPELLWAIAGLVVAARREAADGGAPGREVVVHRPAAEGIVVERAGSRAWVLRGRAAERAANFSDLTDEGALSEAMRRLRRLGVDRALGRAGAHDGDEVTVGQASFLWYRDGALTPSDAAERDRAAGGASPRRRPKGTQRAKGTP